MFGEWETVGGEDLTEDLGGDLEASVVVKVLEETLGIKSVLANNFLEVFNNLLNCGALGICGLSTAVVGHGVGVIEANVNGLFELLLGKDVINRVRESFPAHVLTFFWRLEIFS